MSSVKGTISKGNTNLTAEKVREVLDVLKNCYPDAECALDHGSIYQLVVAVSLSAQTTDASVNRVTPALFAKYPDAKSMADAAKADFEKTVADVTSMIRSIGMYRTKAQNVVKQAVAIVDNFGGQVPSDMESLMSLPGVVRKTANVVMAVGFGQQAMPVDTHVLRVSHRIGLAGESSEGNPNLTEKELISVIPHDRLTEAHHSLIFHGRACCTARSPKCGECRVAEYCCFFAASGENIFKKQNPGGA